MKKFNEWLSERHPNELDENWKKALGAGALGAAMAFGGAGDAQAGTDSVVKQIAQENQKLHLMLSMHRLNSDELEFIAKNSNNPYVKQRLEQWADEYYYKAVQGRRKESQKEIDRLLDLIKYNKDKDADFNPDEYLNRYDNPTKLHVRGASKTPYVYRGAGLER